MQPVLWNLSRLSVAFAVGLGVISAAEFHVAPSGSDAASGTREQPFATLERAREAVRAVRSQDAAAKVPTTVWLHGGDYRRTQTFELSAADSGTAGSPVVWRSTPKERVRLLGGQVLPPLASAWQPVTDAAVLARLDPGARTQVRQLALGAQGIRELGEMKSRGFARPTTAAHPELFFGGQPMTLARWPNEGEFEKIAGFPETAGKGDEHGGKIGDLPGGFLYAGDRPQRWQKSEDLWVHGYWAWDWANSYEHVAELDLNRRLIRTAPPHGLYGFRQGQRFYFLNVLEELDRPGEWFLDRRAGVLYFWPPAPLTSGSANGNSSGSTEAVLSLLDGPLVRFRAASHLQLRGVVLEATRGNGVEIQQGQGVRVSGCLLRNLGNNGVTIDGGSAHRVESCDVFDTGDGGVTLNGGDRQTLQPADHVVDNCHFQRQGRWSKCYVPAVLMTGVGLRATHNHIHDHPHCAILFNGNDHLLEFNDIHHIALETGDVGAIYTGRDYSFRGNRIRHNYIHETGGVGMGSMGVYMDDCVSGTEVYGNIFRHVHWAMFIGGGRDHQVENNIFVDCDPAVRMDGRGLDPSPVWNSMVYDFMRRQLAAVPGELYRQRYPAIRAVDAYLADAARKGVPPEHNVVARNLCLGKWLDVGWRARKEDLHLEDNVVVPSGDAGFVDVRQSFQLRPEAPVWKVGFQRIPEEQIGLQVDELRRELPPATVVARAPGE